MTTDHGSEQSDREADSGSEEASISTRLREASSAPRPPNGAKEADSEAVALQDEVDAEQIVDLDDGNIEELTGDDGLPFDTDRIEALIGTVINDRYRIERSIGRGGMGVIFKARHTTLDRPVVIKVLRPSKINSSLARKRFEREAKRLCRLDNSNVVTIYDFGYIDRLGYLVMEFVDGINLNTFLTRNGPLTFTQLAPLASGILRGLRGAHRGGIVHRDIKASNAMLVIRDNKVAGVKLLDFGLAKLVDGSEDLTKKSELIGSMSAMAPERILGSEGDERVDIYAFGIMCYYLLTGAKPFQGEDVGVLYSHVHDEPPSLLDNLPDGHSLPATFKEFIDLCLAKEPDQRPRDAGQALEWLESTVDNPAVFRITDHPMEVPEGDDVPKDVRSSGEVIFEETTPSWARKRDSSVYKDVSGAELTTDVSPTRSKVIWLAIGLGVAVIAAIVAVALWEKAPGSETDESVAESSAPTEPSSSTSTTTSAGENTSASHLHTAMAKVGAAIEDRRFDAAGAMLSDIHPELAGQPDLLARETDYRKAITKGQTLARARNFEEHNKLDKAITAYRRVSDLDPDDSSAQRKLAALEASAVLAIDSDTEAVVRIDGNKVGSTPLRTIVDASTVQVTVEAPGYDKWTKTVTVHPREKRRMSATLQRPSTRPSHHRPAHQSHSNPDHSGVSGSPDEPTSADEHDRSSESLSDDSLMQME